MPGESLSKLAPSTSENGVVTQDEITQHDITIVADTERRCGHGRHQVMARSISRVSCMSTGRQSNDAWPAVVLILFTASPRQH